MKTPVSPIILEDFNLAAAERRLCVEALGLAGNIVGAAQLLGITRHALKRRIIKLDIHGRAPARWSRNRRSSRMALPVPGSTGSTAVHDKSSVFVD